MDKIWLFRILVSLWFINPLVTTVVETQNLLGCGTISRPQRLYKFSPANYDFNSNTPGTCLQACSSAGFAYASVSAGRLCFCGLMSTNTTFLNLTTTSCEVEPCSGDSTIYCGDIDHELVYKATGFIDSASIEILSVASPLNLMVNEKYQFAASYQGGIDNINYQIDFGDGTQTGWFNGLLNTVTNINHVFTKTGTFSVSLAARVAASFQPAMSSMTVEVYDQISSIDVSLTCPNVTIKEKTAACVLSSVRGTDLMVTFDYNTTNSPHLILNIPNAQYYTYGSSSLSFSPTTDPSANLLAANDIVILPQSLVTVTGRVTSVQFYSSGIGTVNIYLLRRVCVFPLIYCYDTNTCGNCGNSYSFQCSSSSYSTITHSCVNSTLNQRFQQSIYSNVQFEVIAQWTVTTTNVGYQSILANSTATMVNRTAIVGDILAFKSLFIAKQISTDATQDYRCVNPTIASNMFTCSIGNLSANNSQYRYLLQITTVQPIEISPLIMYHDVGLFNVIGTVTQQNTTSYTASVYFPVIYDITSVEIIGPITGDINIFISFTAIVYPINATATMFYWTIDGNSTYNSTSNVYNVSFASTGTYTIGCKVANLLSSKYNITTVNIQDLITNFTLHAGNIANVSTSEPSEVARFQIRMATGSNYACRVNYDTSQMTTETYFYIYGYVPGSYITHQYFEPGEYNVSAQCVNTLSNVTYSFIHYVQSPIVGLQLQEHGIEKNTSFRLNFTFAQGTGLQFLLFFNGTEVSYTYNEQHNLIQTNYFDGQPIAIDFPVEIYAWNHLSSSHVVDTFSIVSRIVNPQIRASTLNTNFPGPIFFEYTMDAGSNVDISFSFGDISNESPVVCNFYPDYPTGTWSSCTGTNHTFEIPGTLRIIAEFKNPISTQYQYITVLLITPVQPIEPVTSLQTGLAQCMAAYVDGRAIASFIIRSTNASAKPAADSQIVIIPDFINQPAYQQGPFQLQLNYFLVPARTSSGLSIIYTSPGNYTAVFLVSNAISSTNISCIVNVLPILQDVYYELNPSSWPLNHTAPLQVSVYVADPNPGPIMFTWDFGDGTIVAGSRTSNQFNQGDTRSHRYASVGTYRITITTSGPVNSIVKTIPVIVQRSVNNFNVNFTNMVGLPSQIAYVGYPTTIRLHVYDSSVPLSSNATLFIDYNDTSPLASQSVVNSRVPYTGFYTFTSPGIYFVNFTLYNYVSSLTKIIKVAINAPFNNYSCKFCYLLPTLTNSLDDRCNLSLYNGRYYVPKQSQLVFYVTWTNPSGVPEVFNVIFRNTSNIVFNQMLSIYQVTNVSSLTGVISSFPLFRLIVDIETNNIIQDGQYTIEVITSNPLYSATHYLNVSILSAIAGLTITSIDDAVPIDVPKSFLANYQNFSSISCLYIKYSDNIIECYGDQATCLSLPADLSQILQTCTLPIQSFTYSNFSVTFTRSFNNTNSWLYAYAWNYVTLISARTFLSFTLSTGGCGVPVINFDIYNPIMRWARTIQYSAAFSVSTRTILNCSNSLNNTKQWKILQCDVTTESCYETFMLSQLTSQLSSASTAEIYIQAQTLRIGTYLFNHTVRMNLLNGFHASSFTYIKIVPSNIRVNMLANGTSMITTGVSQSVLFQPGLYSIDPDSNYFNSDAWSFQYYCRIYAQGSYPRYLGEEITIESTIIDPANPSCFRSPGNTSLFKYGPDSNRSMLYIQPYALPSDRSYEFKVVLTHLQDSSIKHTGYALVQLLDTDSILISVSCVIKMCSENVEYQRVNPTTQILLASDCGQACENATDTVIQWNVYRGFQLNYPNNDVRWVLYTNMSAYDEILFYGRKTKNFTAIERLFLSNPTVLYWKFEAAYVVTVDSGIIYGMGAIRFSINSPPSNGTCTINRLNGTSTTLFQITCMNWFDSDGVKGYSFIARTSVNDSQTIIGFTRLNTMDLYLPIGDPNRNYTIEMTVEIQDIYDAVTQFQLPNITVTPDNQSISNFIQLVQQAQTQGSTNNEFERILYGGDQNLASQLVLSLSQSLNSGSLASQENAASNNLLVQNLCVSGLSATNTNYYTYNASANTTDSLTAYTAHLNEQATVRDYVISFITNLPITDINSIQLQASTMNYLTTETSELTRQAASFASSKLNELTNALDDMSDTISYENVQVAVDSIAQTAANVLVAVNAPLLGRGVALNLDYDRANTLPADYEADLEEPWSDPNLFADGSDFSMETLQKNRNLYYQQHESNKVANQVANTLQKSVSILSKHMNLGQKKTITTNSISMVTEKLNLQRLKSKSHDIPQAAGAKLNLPDIPFCDYMSKNQPCTNDTEITLNSIMLPLAATGQNGRTEAYVNMSRSLSLSFIDSSGKTVPIINLSQPIELIIPRDSNLFVPPMTVQNVTGTSASTTMTSSNNNRQFALYYVNVTSPKPTVTISATFELQPDNLTLGYLLIFRFDNTPILNSSMNKTDGYQILCPAAQISTIRDGQLYSYFLNNIQTANHTYVMFGIRELNSTEFSMYCVNPSNLSLPITDASANFTSNYKIRSYTSGCYYFDENSAWRSDNVIVGSNTTHEQTQCYAYHLTTFASGWIVLPAPINWNYVFSNADFSKNKTIYLTIILIAIIYILFMIYARYKDKKDIEKLGVTPLPDNILNDKYYYQIIVFTGLRKDAGTKSKVHFVISGDDQETGVRTFADPHRKILQRGGIDSFIMAVPKSLGRLNYMRIWHDNSGSGNNASWFLKYIVVRDLQTMEKNHFICQQWLAIEKDDGSIDRLLPVAGETQKSEFAYLLSKKTYYSMSDGHLWFSVFSRPPSTNFTRTQRCTCCFVLLLMSMFMNIMYYDQSAEAKSKNSGGITMGPFYITPEQIAIGVIVELICFLPSTILVEMFRRLRPRRRRTSPVREALEKIQNDRQKRQQNAALNDIQPNLTNFTANQNLNLSMSNLDLTRNKLETSLSNKQTLSISNKIDANLQKKKRKRTLPWWFIFVAYGLSFLVVSVSILFIIARGIEFGDMKTRQWLTSSITGFFSSVLLSQPTKVIFTAIFFALIIRRDTDDLIDDDNDDIFLDGDEQYLHAFDDGSLLTFRTKAGHIPLTYGELAYARDKRLKEIKMWEILRELFAYLSFLWILYLVSYSNRDPNAFFLMEHLKKDFLNIDNVTTGFLPIYRLDQYWDWLSTSFVPNLRASNWYNGDKPANLAGFIGDKTNRILGWATIRQLRVKADSCKILSSFKNIVSTCEAAYNIFNEEQNSFNPGWTSVYDPFASHIGNYSSTIRRAFMYNNSNHLDTYVYIGDHATYSAGGYIYEFRGKMNEMFANLSLLRQLSWLDMQTRAVIIQTSLYNPNVNLFVFVTILAEFLPTGGVYTSARVEPIALLNDYQGFGLFKLICAIIYMAFIVYYMQREIRSLFTRRFKYFFDFWSYPEMGIIICSWIGLVVYIWRLRESNRIGDLFRQTNGYAYINLQFASYVNDFLTFLLGFCCFFGTIKFLRLLRFNKRMSMLSSTLAYSAKDLISFTVMFSIIFCGYLGLFFLLFHSNIWACADPIRTAQMLFEMMLLKFDVSDLYAANIFLGPFCFTLFVIFVVFICMNMFISIISDSFRVVRRNIALQSCEHEIVSFMVNQFKKWTGLGKTQEVDRLHLNPFDGTRVQYQDPITAFPDKMDELLIALDKIYMDTKRNDAFIFHPVDNNQSGTDGKLNKNTHKSKNK